MEMNELNKMMVREMFDHIRKLEAENVRNGKRSDSQMSRMIAEYIENKVRKEKK